MPYRSEKQRRYMHAKHPTIAKRWDKKYGSKIVKKKDKNFYENVKVQTLY